MSLANYVLLICLMFCQSVAKPRVVSHDLLQSVLENVDGALRFFSSDYSSINVDGLFGMRAGQGQIQLAIKECEARSSCSEDILSRLAIIERTLDETCEKAMPYVEQQDEQYYSRFLKTIDSPYLTPYRPTKFESLEGIEVGKDAQYNEPEGDECLARMMGTHVDQNVKLPLCNVTHYCWDFMTKPNTRRYVITHQLLYFIIIEHVGCMQQVEEFIDDKIEKIQADFCKKIYKESEALAMNGNVDLFSRDLFFEQTMLCASLGFEDFTRIDWLQMALKWQNKKDGCFKFDDMKPDTTAEEILAKELMERRENEPKESKEFEFFVDNRASLQKAKHRGYFDIARSSGNKSMRKLLRERVMKDGCLSHTTGLGFATYSTYLHYLVRQL